VQLDKTLWDSALRLMTEEVQLAIAGGGSDEFEQFTNRIGWQTFLSRTRRLEAWAEPVRLASGPAGRSGRPCPWRS